MEQHFISSPIIELTLHYWSHWTKQGCVEANVIELNICVFISHKFKFLLVTERMSCFYFQKLHSFALMQHCSTLPLMFSLLSDIYCI